MINLLPPEMKKSIRFARLNVTMIEYCVLVIIVGLALLGIFVFGGTIVASNESDLQTSIDENKGKIAELESVKSQAEQLSASIDTIGTLLSREVRFSELLNEIGSVLPEGAVLTNLAISDTHEEPLTLDAFVTDEEVAAVFRENLADSKLFSGADIISITLSEGNNELNGKNYRFTAVYRAYFIQSSSTQTEESTDTNESTDTGSTDETSDTPEETGQ